MDYQVDADVAEVAFLLGYEDSNSFYRAVRTWEGTTPSQLRAALLRADRQAANAGDGGAEDV
jgi:AraC-like DNA-binding protein